MDTSEQILNRLASAEEDIEDLNRGVYGDDKNEVPGIHQRVGVIERILKKMQDDRKTDKTKFVYFCMGASAVIGVIGWLIEHFFFK